VKIAFKNWGSTVFGNGVVKTPPNSVLSNLFIGLREVSRKKLLKVYY
jgi:hypothetical protein